MKRFELPWLMLDYLRNMGFSLDDAPCMGRYYAICEFTEACGTWYIAIPTIITDHGFAQENMDFPGNDNIRTVYRHMDKKTTITEIRHIILMDNKDMWDRLSYEGEGDKKVFEPTLAEILHIFYESGIRYVIDGKQPQPAPPAPASTQPL
jgi:hypothetical protein